MLGYFFCKVICICQNSSVAGRQPPGEDVGEGCSVPATYQNDRSSISNILGNSWGLPIHVLRVVWIFSLLRGRKFAPPSWLRLDCRHCRSLPSPPPPHHDHCHLRRTQECTHVQPQTVWEVLQGLSLISKSFVSIRYCR